MVEMWSAMSADNACTVLFLIYTKEAFNRHQDILSEISVKYAAFVLGQVKDFGFNNTVSLNYKFKIKI